MAASDKLVELAQRAKVAEDRVAAAKSQARSEVEAQVAKTRDAAQQKADQLRPRPPRRPVVPSSGGLTYKAPGLDTSPAFAETSRVGSPRWTPSRPGVAPSRPRTMPSAPLPSPKPHSRRLSTRSYMPPSPAWTPPRRSVAWCRVACWSTRGSPSPEPSWRGLSPRANRSRIPSRSASGVPGPSSAKASVTADPCLSGQVGRRVRIHAGCRWMRDRAEGGSCCPQAIEVKRWRWP